MENCIGEVSLGASHLTGANDRRDLPYDRACGTGWVK